MFPGNRGPGRTLPDLDQDGGSQILLGSQMSNGNSSAEETMVWKAILLLDLQGTILTATCCSDFLAIDGASASLWT